MRELLPGIEGSGRGDDAFDEGALASAVTSVDIHGSFDALASAIASGASMDRLITSFVLLAADRMARTPVAVDAGWPNLTRELNLASSLRALNRHGGAAARGLFHAAWHVFADRWINIDHRPLSEPLQPQPSPAANEDAAAARVLDAMQTLDVEAAGARVAGYVQAGYSGERLLHDMGRAILQDDTGHEILPTLRTVFDEWGNATGTHADLGAGHPASAQLLVGLARYATDVRSNSDGRSAAVTAMRFAEGRTTVEMFE
ncbi:MAG: hypothetical protein OXL38_07900 [Gammaproteobacteria bacterium]|nr:hypothetical protein [Gammaproteobacteria bacterium]